MALKAALRQGRPESWPGKREGKGMDIQDGQDKLRKGKPPILHILSIHVAFLLENLVYSGCGSSALTLAGAR